METSFPSSLSAPRKGHPERYLKCLDLLSNKVPLDAIDTWFWLGVGPTAKPWIWKIEVHQSVRLVMADDEVILRETDTDPNMQNMHHFRNMSRHVQVNMNQGMTILFMLQEFSGVQHFTSLTHVFLSANVAEDRRKGLSPIQLVAGHGNWHEHDLQDSEIHLVFVARLQPLVNGIWRMSKALLLKNLCISNCLLGRRCYW